MKEDFLQFLWKYKKFNPSCLRTTDNHEVIIKQVGTHNLENSGPDFFNAQITIHNQKWAGNVEIHIKSSDWYAHHHENDLAYNNVILHVVWFDDIKVFRKDNSSIPTLVLKDYIDEKLLFRYQKLFERTFKKWILCENQLSNVSDFVLVNWQDRLYLERLEQKSILISELLKSSANNWETVMFKMLAKNFGLKVNGDAFLSFANSFDFSVLRKCTHDLGQLEALFFGQAGFLEKEKDNYYSKKLKIEYDFLKTKFGLKPIHAISMQFFRLRPSNFPTIRLAQLAKLYFKNDRLFSRIIQTYDINEFYQIFNVGTSSFWERHYTFDKESKPRQKQMTKQFVDLIVINTIIPMQFSYARSQGKYVEEEIFKLISQISYEKNTIIDNFIKHKVPIKTAMHSQAMLQLKNMYCDQKKCLKCAIGNNLLNQD